MAALAAVLGIVLALFVRTGVGLLSPNPAGWRRTTTPLPRASIHRT